MSAAQLNESSENGQLTFNNIIAKSEDKAINFL